MAKQVTKLDVLSIYKKLLRESQKFDSYNYRWVLAIAWQFPMGKYMNILHYVIAGTMP